MVLIILLSDVWVSLMGDGSWYLCNTIVIIPATPQLSKLITTELYMNVLDISMMVLED